MARPKKNQSRSTGQTSSPRKKNSRVAQPVITRSKPVKTTSNRGVRTKLPGAIAHSLASWRFLRDNKGLLARLLLVTWLVLTLVIGISQQAQYQSTRDMAELYSGEVAEGGARKAFEIGVLLIAIVSGGQNTGLSESQQLFTGLVYLLLWMTTIWLIRHRLAGGEISLRDGIYSAGAPLVTISIISLVALIQLLPFTIGLTLYAMAGGTLQGSAIGIIAVIGLLALGAATLYWLVATVFAAIIATIPGTYPVAALRSARQLISGQRTPVLLRLLWLGLVSFIIFVIGVAVTITLDRLLGSASTLFVAAMIQLIMLAIALYAITYTYLLYRKAVDERS